MEGTVTKYYAHDVNNLQELVNSQMDVTIIITRDPQQISCPNQTNVTIKIKPFSDHCGLQIDAKERDINIEKTINKMVSALLNNMERWYSEKTQNK